MATVFLSGISVTDAEKAFRANLSDIASCIKTVDSQRSIHVSLELHSNGRVSDLELSGARVAVDEACLGDVQGRMNFPIQVEALQYLDFRTVYVESTLRLLPDITIRLPEIIFPGIFSDQATKQKLLESIDK